MPHIIPIRDLKNTSEISQLCHSTDSPVFITKNGYGDMVIMSIKVYEKIFNEHDIAKKLMVGIKDAEEGRVVDGETVMKQFKEKYDL